MFGGNSQIRAEVVTIPQKLTKNGYKVVKKVMGIPIKYEDLISEYFLMDQIYELIQSSSNIHSGSELNSMVIKTKLHIKFERRMFEFYYFTISDTVSALGGLAATFSLILG